MNKRTKILLLDIFILIFLIFTLVFTANYFFNQDTMLDVNEKANVVLVLNVDNISEKNIHLINVSDMVYSSDSGENIGIIKDIKKQEAAFSAEEQAGETYLKPCQYNLNLTVECMLSYDKKNNAHLINNSIIKNGDRILLHTPEYEFFATIMQVTSFSNFLNTSELQNEKEQY